jgi:hypothetical protein
MIGASHHHRFGPIVWGAIGVAVTVLTVIAVNRGDTRIASYTIKILVLVCLAVCRTTLRLDARTRRATDQLVDQLHHRSTRNVAGCRSLGVPRDS